FSLPSLSTPVDDTLSLHDALPISAATPRVNAPATVTMVRDDAADVSDIAFLSMMLGTAAAAGVLGAILGLGGGILLVPVLTLFLDRKSTRLNSSHQIISYAVFCLQ